MTFSKLIAQHIYLVRDKDFVACHNFFSNFVSNTVSNFFLVSVHIRRIKMTIATIDGISHSKFDDTRRRLEIKSNKFKIIFMYKLVTENYL